MFLNEIGDHIVVGLQCDVQLLTLHEIFLVSMAVLFFFLSFHNVPL